MRERELVRVWWWSTAGCYSELCHPEAAAAACERLRGEGKLVWTTQCLTVKPEASDRS